MTKADDFTTNKDDQAVMELILPINSKELYLKEVASTTKDGTRYVNPLKDRVCITAEVVETDEGYDIYIDDTMLAGGLFGEDTQATMIENTMALYGISEEEARENVNNNVNALRSIDPLSDVKVEDSNGVLAAQKDDYVKRGLGLVSAGATMSVIVNGKEYFLGSQRDIKEGLAYAGAGQTQSGRLDQRVSDTSMSELNEELVAFIESEDGYFYPVLLDHEAFGHGSVTKADKQKQIELLIEKKSQELVDAGIDPEYIEYDSVLTLPVQPDRNPGKLVTVNTFIDGELDESVEVNAIWIQEDRTLETSIPCQIDLDALHGKEVDGVKVKDMKFIGGEPFGYPMFMMEASELATYIEIRNERVLSGQPMTKEIYKGLIPYEGQNGTFLGFLVITDAYIAAKNNLPLAMKADYVQQQEQTPKAAKRDQAPGTP